MATTVKRRILRIDTDDLENLITPQIGFEQASADNCDLMSYFDGGYGGKGSDNKVYRFAKFSERNYFKSIYMTDGIVAGTVPNCPNTPTSYSILTITHRNEILNPSSPDLYSDGFTTIRRMANSINIGEGAGIKSDTSSNISGLHTINVGIQSGFKSSGVESINLGFNTSNGSSGDRSIAIGSGANTNAQSGGSIIMGALSNINGQAANSVIIGRNAGNSCNIVDGVFIGRQSGDHSIGMRDVYIGTYAGSQISNSVENIAIGFTAGSFCTYGSINNVMVGGGGVGNTPTSSIARNVMCGYASGISISGEDNIMLGTASGNRISGNNNISIGEDTLYNISGNDNVAIGKGSGYATTGNNNISIGSYSGETGLGDFNITLGRRVRSYEAPNSNGWDTGFLGSTFLGSTDYYKGKFVVGYHENDSTYNRLLWGDMLAGRLNIDKALNLTPLDTLISPAYKGDLVFDNSVGQNKPKYFDGSAWQALGGGASSFVTLSDTPTSYTGSAYKIVAVNGSQTALVFPQLLSIDDATQSIWVKDAGFQFRDDLNVNLMEFDVRRSTDTDAGDSYIHAYENTALVGGNLHLETDYGIYADSYNYSFMSWGVVDNVNPRLEFMRYDNTVTYPGGARLFLPRTRISDLNVAGMEKALVTREWVVDYTPLPTGAINEIITCNGSNGWQNSGVTLEVSGFDKWLDFKAAHARLKASGTIAMNINTDATSFTDTFSIIDNATTIFTSYGIGDTNYGCADLPVCTKAGINAVGAKAIVTKEYADFKVSTATISPTMTLDYLTSDFTRISMTSVNSGTITTINNMTVGQGMIVYVEKTVTGGTGLVFNVTGTPITVLGPTVTGKYSFVISKVTLSTYMVSKPAESLGIV